MEIYQGITTPSIWSNSIGINQLRPKIADIPAIIQNVKYTGGDLIEISFNDNVPFFNMSSFIPTVPPIPTKTGFSPPSIMLPETAPESSTSILLNKVRGLKAYSING